MSEREQVTVSRDVKTVQIPDGTPFILSEGTQVEILQSLGGSYTVIGPYGQMLRVSEGDVDALGKEVPAAAGAEGGEAASLEQQVWERLRTCYDPEIPVNIVDLGLVYSCNLAEEPETGTTVAIQMTLTAPGCGMGPVLARDVQEKIEALAGVAKADIEVVFDPPWNPAMMTEAARLQLGFF